MNYEDIWTELKNRINLNINENISRTELLNFMTGLEGYLELRDTDQENDVDQES
jgi:hypothetical protein